MELVLKKNQAAYIAIPMIDDTSPTSFKTGLSPTDTAYSKTTSGAWTSRSITDTFAEIGSTGIYEIDLTAAELNYDQYLIKVTASGAADTMILIRLFDAEIDDLVRSTTPANTLDVSATGEAGIDWANVGGQGTTVDLSDTSINLCDTVTTLTGHTNQTGDNYARIGVNGAGLTNIDLPNQTMDITGSLSGSVGSVTGAVGSVTGAVGSVTGNVGGNVVGSVASVTADVGITATAVDNIWDEDIVAAHGSADTSGLIVSELSKRNITWATAIVAGSALDQIADDGTASYDRTTDSLQANRDKLTDIETDTGEIGAAGAGLSNIDLPDQTMNITGNLSGSVGSVTGAVDSVTNAVGSVTGNVGGNVTGSVGSVAAGGVTASSIATDAIGSDELAASAAQKIRDEILPTQNVALDNIEFLWVAASDHVTPVTAASTTSVTRSIDGGAFGAATGTLAEVGNGIYQFDASQADMNGGIITFRFVATGGTPGAPDDAFVTIVTGGGV
jgi:hypothetical protein